MTAENADWRKGFQRGADHTRDKIWSAVWEYVHQHDPQRADDLREAVVKALTEKTVREKQLDGLESVSPDKVRLAKLEADVEKLRAGLENIKTMNYDAGYSADEYAAAVLSGDEPKPE